MDLFNRKQERYEMCSRFLSRLEKSGNLLELFSLHRQIWDSGLRHQNIGPCEWGMFRTEDISRMVPSEVHLGGIAGLSTLPIPEWIGTPDEHVVTQQYRGHLISNVSYLQSLIYDNGLCRDSICRGIAEASGGVLRPEQIRILDDSLDMNRLHSFIFMVGQDRRVSNFIIASGGNKVDLMLLPENWMQGQQIKSAFQIGKIPVWKDHRFPEYSFKVTKESLGGKLKATFTTHQESQQARQSQAAARSIRR